MSSQDQRQTHFEWLHSNTKYFTDLLVNVLHNDTLSNILYIYGNWEEDYQS